MHILQFSAFTDNYIWALKKKNQLVVIDPGDYRPIKDFFTKNPSILLAGIFITHHHLDHVGGIEELLKLANLDKKDSIFLNGATCKSLIPVFGPPNCKKFGVNTILKEGDRINWGDTLIEILDIRGHTDEHLGYYCDGSDDVISPFVFSGDTLFAGGCGRVLGGSISNLFHSLNKLSNLPKNTLVYCAHEYTLDNLNFAADVFPGDRKIAARKKNVEFYRSKNISTVPSTIGEELQTNPFYRVHELEEFIELRKMKDVWT